MGLTAHIGEQVRHVNRNPSEGQKSAGNYRKGHVKLHGLDISIENPRGSYRSGKTEGGGTWRSRLPHHYGYIRGTEGSDGDHVDVFLGPHLFGSAVYIVDQKDLRTGDHDEHKVMLGFGSEKEAREGYCRAFSDGKGPARISSVEGMTMEKFKDWLKTKRRAAGGRVGYAEGGAPPFEMTSDVPAFDQTEPVEDAGKMDAALRGAKAGVTMNFGDEIIGARANAPKWVPELVGPIPARTLAGVAKTGLGYLTGNEETTKTYEAARDAERRAAASAKRNHPYIYAGSELAGAVPAMAALPELGAAKALAPAASRIAKFGAGVLDSAVAGGQYGAVAGAGEGEGIADRAVNVATGLVSGILGGAGAHAIGTGTGALATKYGAPVVSTIRGWVDQKGEASRRLAAALRSDQDLIANGQATGMTPQQWLAARQAGEPVTLADLGSARTQALLRSAANTSPEGRAMLERVLEERFATQSQRFADTVRSAIPGAPANARKTADQLVAEYDAARSPLYKKAYKEGDQQIFTPVIDRLTGSPTFGQAMVGAIKSGKDRAITEGYGAFQPPVSVGPSGNFVFNRAGPNAGPVYPNLQYWDAVKRELDDMASKAFRAGENGRGDVASRMARSLRDELDQFSPSYAKARGVAADFFGEKNALEAGRKLAGKRVDPEEVAQVLRKMKPDERDLFREGYASDLAERVILNMKDTSNITKGRGILQSPNERRLASVIFGPGGMAQLQARMHLETIMDGARQAMGNSTTARQLIEAGLAGGAGGLFGGMTSGWDPLRTAEGFGVAAGARLGSSKFIPEQFKVGAKHLIGKVDAKTARRVAELLTSDDPRLLREGYRMAAKSEAIMQGLRNIANRVALAGQTPARQPVAEGFRALQGPVSASADEQQQRP